VFRIRRTLNPVAAVSLFSSLRMLRSQILHRQLDYVACAIAPLVARKATEKEPTAIVDYDERQFAFMAGGGHGSSYHVWRRLRWRSSSEASLDRASEWMQPACPLISAD
jgi:hypothetical protein